MKVSCDSVSYGTPASVTQRAFLYLGNTWLSSTKLPLARPWVDKGLTSSFSEPPKMQHHYTASGGSSRLSLWLPLIRCTEGHFGLTDILTRMLRTCSGVQFGRAMPSLAQCRTDLVRLNTRGESVAHRITPPCRLSARMKNLH